MSRLTPEEIRAFKNSYIDVMTSKIGPEKAVLGSKLIVDSHKYQFTKPVAESLIVRLNEWFLVMDKTSFIIRIRDILKDGLDKRIKKGVGI